MEFALLAAGVLLAVWLSLPSGEADGPRYDRRGLRNNREGREHMRREHEARCCARED